MGARVPVADETFRVGVDVLFGHTHTLAKRGRKGRFRDPNAAAGSLGSRCLLTPSNGRERFPRRPRKRLAGILAPQWPEEGQNGSRAAPLGRREAAEEAEHEDESRGVHHGSEQEGGAGQLHRGGG